MPKIKVLHIIKSLGRGGAEMLLPETLKLHDQERFEFHYIYFLPWKDQMADSLRKNGGKVTCLAANNNFQILLKTGVVVSYIRENNIQLVHAHLPWAGILARLVGRKCRISILYTEHNKQERYHFLTRVLNLRTLHLCTRIVAVSQDVRDSIVRYKPSVGHKVNIILNGVNTEHFDPQAFSSAIVRNSLKIPKDCHVIGTIAVFRFQKRLDVWLETAKKISEQNPRVHFVIVGDGPLKSALLKKRNELGLEGIVHMPGLETEVRPYLAAFDIYMMSSIFEGLPIALLEAMSMECAVVATNAGGVGEVVRHGIDGILCDTGMTEKLPDHALLLLSDERLRLRYKIQARKRIQELFSLDKMVTELEQLYRDNTLLQ